MRLQPLLLCKELGFKALPVGYSHAAYTNGRTKFAEAYLRGDIACKRVVFGEQFNAPTAIGGVHRRAPVQAIVYGTREQIALIHELFIVQVTNEPFATENPSVKAWLRVGGSLSDNRSSYHPLLIVRELVDLTRVDQFFRPIMDKITREHSS